MPTGRLPRRVASFCMLRLPVRAKVRSSQGSLYAFLVGVLSSDPITGDEDCVVGEELWLWSRGWDEDGADDAEAGLGEAASWASSRALLARSSRLRAWSSLEKSGWGEVANAEPAKLGGAQQTPWTSQTTPSQL